MMSMKRHAGRLLSSSPSLQRVNSGECLNLNDDVDNDVGTLSRQWSTRSASADPNPISNQSWSRLSMASRTNTRCAGRSFIGEMTEHQLKLQKQKINTVHTKRLDQAKEHLGRNNLLILVGNEGDGVTTLGMDILASYDDRERYNVKDVEETFECLTKTADKNIIVLVNDVFGTNKLNMKRFESWDTNMDRIETRIDIDDSILVLVINSKTMNTTACEEFCRRHFDGVLTISKPDLQLDIAEMKGILKCRIKSKKGIEICRFDNQENLHRDFDRGISGLYRISQNTIDSIANTALNSGFPRKVDQFVNRLSDRNLRKGAAFFNEPTPELVNDIEQLRLSDNAKDQYKYISLVAVFVYGQLNLKEFESGILRLQNSGKLSKLKRIARSGAKSKEYPELLHILVAIAKERNMLPWLVDVVGRGLELLLDKYVKGLKHDNYLLASVSIEMAVAVSCANRFPIDVCIFSSQCAFQCIFGPDDVFEKNEVHVSVKENDKTLLLAVMQRLSLIQETKELKMFLQHPAMRSAWFVQLYLKYLKSKKHGLKKLILATDTNNNSILVLSLEYPYKPTTMIGTKCLTDDILNSKEWLQIQKKRPRFVDKQYKCIVQKCYEFDSKSYFSYYLEILDVELTKHALFLAVDDYCRNIIEELIKRKLFTDDEWYEALKRACNQLKTDDEDTMKIVLAIKYRIGFDYQSRAVESIIHTAGRQGNIDLLSKVVTLYKNKNFQNYIGQTCIHIATTMNHLDFVKQALDFGISQTILDKQCLLPLHIACKYGHMDIVKILISHDIEVINYVSDSCGSPLLVATACGHDKIASYLIANGARSFRYLTGRSHMTFGECLNLEDDVDYDEGTLSRQGNTRSVPESDVNVQNSSNVLSRHQTLQLLEKVEDCSTLAIMQNKDLLQFDIPLTVTGSARLGVSVKEIILTTEEGTRDLGVFVKAIINGGAASKDGRLQVNDQLLELNSNSLVNLSNTESMDVIRKAMQEEGLVPGCINIKVARWIGAPSLYSQTSPIVFDKTDSINEMSGK